MKLRFANYIANLFFNVKAKPKMVKSDMYPLVYIAFTAVP